MPDATPGAGEMPDPTQPAGETPALEFDTWLQAQDTAVRGMLDSHTQGLRSALETERGNAKQLARQIKDLSGKVEAGSETARQLADLSSRLETEQRRADFYESATAAGCRDLRLAWLAARDEGLTVEQVRTQYPTLFAVAKVPPTHAGNGAQAPGGGGERNINAFIRRAAGR